MLLYDSPVSGNCYKVRLLCAHLGIAFQRRAVDVVDRSDPREFLDGLNPARRVPTLVLDGRWIELEGAPVAAADLEHAAAQTGEQPPSVLARDVVRPALLAPLEVAREARLARAVERHCFRGHARRESHSR